MSRRVIALVLAAGHSRRMGRLKQLLPYRDGTILEAVLDAVLESSVDGLCVVANLQVREFLGDDLPDRFIVAANDKPESEMLESLKIGIRAIQEEFETDDDDGVMVLLADQPQVTGGIITTVAEDWRLPRKKPPGILIATYAGRRGHPAIFSMEMLREIDPWGHDRRLSELADLHPDRVHELPLIAAAPLLDVNTPDDYDRLRKSE